ncbi:hypothetical protein C8R45DRAFT_960835 [Mycena sanguinolenta]|nr:hypothetical protein C8R45DRAFT_960835 [Mycena sanguinolenta]
MLSSMEADRARLSKIEAEILDLQDSLSTLRAEKQLVQRRLDSYKYPVLALPNEMVSEIFVHTLPPYPLCPALLGTDPPTTLTHICRKWREIALATPELWRAIRVNDFYAPRRPISEAWAKRSGSFPLSINIDIGRSGEIYPELLDRRVRWEHLTLNVYAPVVLIIDGPLPLLHHLELAQHDEIGRFELRDATQLRSVVFRYKFSKEVTLPWQQLTRMTIDHIRADRCLPILQQTTNLVHCDLALWFPVNYELNDEPRPHITLPFVETFVFNISPQNIGTQLLDLFTMPTLRSLTVPERCLGLDPVVFLNAFLAKSHCRLQYLDITGRRSRIRSTYRTAFPSIPNLVFNRSYFGESSDEEDSKDVEDDSESNEDDSDNSAEDSEDFASSDGQTDSD